jgi:hypothetical protein
MKQENNSPTNVIKAFIIARCNGDIEAVKGTLAKSTLEVIERISVNQEKSFNAALNTVKRFIVQPDSERLPNTRNEKIGGDTACVEVENFVSGESDTFVFVRENNIWKLALEMEVFDATMNETSIYECLSNCVQNIFKILLGKVKTKS